MDDERFIDQLLEGLIDADTAEGALGDLSDLVLYELISTAEAVLWKRQQKALSSQNTVVAHAEIAL